jgi:hypothetical protein
MRRLLLASIHVSSRIAGPTASAAALAASLMVAAPTIAQQAPDEHPRGRVLTIYDAATHRPIDGVEVVDLLAAKYGMANDRAFTNDSGRVLLAFLRRQHDSAVVQVAKPGYEERRFIVMVGAADTAPLSVALAPATSPARATSKVSTGKRSFAIFDSVTKQALDGVEVSDALGAGTAVTDARGGAAVVVTYTGAKAMVMLKKVGYAPTTLVIDASDTTSTIRQDLPRLVDLPAVTANAPRTDILSRLMEGFEERRKIGLGKFITPEQMRKYDGMTLAMALASRGMIPVNRTGGSCRGGPLTFVDGVRQQGQSWAGPDTDQYDAAEYYASSATAPAEFSAPGARCGILLLYTRKQL